MLQTAPVSCISMDSTSMEFEHPVDSELFDNATETVTSNGRPSAKRRKLVVATNSHATVIPEKNKTFSEPEQLPQRGHNTSTWFPSLSGYEMPPCLREKS